MSRKQKKKAQKNKKPKKKVVTENQLLTEKIHYKFTPSFIEHNGRIATILKMYYRTGSNRAMSFSDIIDFIPTSALDGIEMHLIADDAIINGDQKAKIIKNNTVDNKASIEAEEDTAEKADQNNQSEKNQREADIDDNNDYERIIENSEPIVIFRWLLMIIGDSQEQIDEQIEILEVSLKQNHDGVTWESVPGNQQHRFESLFEPIEKSAKEHTSTGSNYAGLNLAVSAGLRDMYGLPLGIDALSITGSVAYFDFVNSTYSQATIAIPEGSYISRYYRKNSTKQISAASIVAQTAANQFAMTGRRVHHIVLNDFNYLEPNMYIRPEDTEDILNEFDVTKLTVNPLQGFGKIEDVVSVYERLVNKIVNIFDLLMNLQLTVDQRAIVLEAVGNFYLSQGLYRADAAEKPKLTRIVEIENPETYPTMGQLISQFSIGVRKAMNENRELKATGVETLEQTLNHALTSYTSVLGRPTSIVDSKALQTYYSFRNTTSTMLKQIQFINLIDYIIYQAAEHDLIVIHGFDSILSKVSTMVLETIEAAKKKGIKFLYVFDSVVAPESTLGKMNDIFEMKSKYYTDLDTDMDWSFIGKCIPEELDKLKEALNTELGSTIENQLLQKLPNQVLIHRREGAVNNFVRLNPVI